MAALTVRNVSDDTKQALRMRAALRGASMEDEVRSILRAVVDSGISLEDLSKRPPDGGSAWDTIRALREKFGTFDLDVPERIDLAGELKIFQDK